MLGDVYCGSNQYISRLYSPDKIDKIYTVHRSGDSFGKRGWYVPYVPFWLEMERVLEKIERYQKREEKKRKEKRRKEKKMDDKSKNLMSDEQYEAYVKEKTPTHNVYVNMLRAFITGGCICTIGQVIWNIYSNLGYDTEMSGTWTSITLIGISMILTGMNLYTKLANWGGAGALVPITGFANSVVSPAIEYSVEGAVNGIGTRIFVIAGPVILYGVFTSWVFGVLYFILQYIGLM